VVGAAAGGPRDGRSFISGVDRLPLLTETVGEHLLRRAEVAPDLPALMWAAADGPQQLTWSQLAQRARRGAAGLLDINPPRRRVALVGFNSVDWIVAMYACAVAGMPVVPIHPNATDEEVRHFLTLADVDVALCARDSGSLDRFAALGRPLVRDMASIDAENPADLAPIAPEHEFLIQFTSGTTGLPKAASLSHRAALNCGFLYGRACGGAEGDRWLNPLPLNHVGGSISGVITTLAFGGVYTVVERFTPQALIDAIRQVGPTWLGLVPTMLMDLLEMPGVEESDFATVRTIAGGAASVDPNLIAAVEQRLGVTVMVAYGQSEAPNMASSSPDDSAHVRTRTLGRPLAGRDFAIRGSDGAIVPIGEVGELCVRGPLTMTGYLRPDGGIDPAVDTEGWRPTGDLCTMDDEGVLTFCGRIREVIIRGGLNVYPAEVERAVSSHESVSEIAVFGVSDERLGERPVAAVLPAAEGDVNIDELVGTAAARLSSYKRPTEWIVVASLPRTSTGKVRKHLLREWYEAGTLTDNCGGRRPD